MRKKGNTEKKDLNLFSPTLITTYSGRAIDFITSIERFLYILIPLLIIFALVILFDTTAMKNYVQLLSDDIFDLLAVAFTFIIIGTVIYILKVIINIRKRLDNWAYLFEKSSIRTSISMSLSKIGHAEILDSIVDSIEEIGFPLSQYILNDAMSVKRFTNQIFPNDFEFDILIDEGRIDDSKDKNTHFKSKINEYGSIIVKIVDGPITIDSNTVESFIQSILRYVKITNKFVGLALLIGNEVSTEAMELIANYSNKSIGYLIVIDKPIILDPVH
ncbi:MAG: hypothetical protein ACTHKJ_10270 [Candidatus Nitrosocosmicus sp.]